MKKEKEGDHQIQELKNQLSNLGSNKHFGKIINITVP